MFRVGFECGSKVPAIYTAESEVTINDDEEIVAYFDEFLNFDVPIKLDKKTGEPKLLEGRIIVHQLQKGKSTKCIGHCNVRLHGFLDTDDAVDIRAALTQCPTEDGYINFSIYSGQDEENESAGEEGRSKDGEQSDDDEEEDLSIYAQNKRKSANSTNVSGFGFVTHSSSSSSKTHQSNNPGSAKPNGHVLTLDGGQAQSAKFSSSYNISNNSLARTNSNRMAGDNSSSSSNGSAKQAVFQCRYCNLTALNLTDTTNVGPGHNADCPRYAPKKGGVSAADVLAAGGPASTTSSQSGSPRSSQYERDTGLLQVDRMSSGLSDSMTGGGSGGGEGGGAKGSSGSSFLMAADFRFEASRKHHEMRERLKVLEEELQLARQLVSNANSDENMRNHMQEMSEELKNVKKQNKDLLSLNDQLCREATAAEKKHNMALDKARAEALDAHTQLQIKVDENEALVADLLDCKMTISSLRKDLDMYRKERVSSGQPALTRAPSSGSLASMTSNGTTNDVTPPSTGNIVRRAAPAGGTAATSAAADQSTSPTAGVSSSEQLALPAPNFQHLHKQWRNSNSGNNGSSEVSQPPLRQQQQQQQPRSHSRSASFSVDTGSTNSSLHSGSYDSRDQSVAAGNNQRSQGGGSSAYRYDDRQYDQQQQYSNRNTPPVQPIVSTSKYYTPPDPRLQRYSSPGPGGGSMNNTPPPNAVPHPLLDHPVVSAATSGGGGDFYVSSYGPRVAAQHTRSGSMTKFERMSMDGGATGGGWGSRGPSPARGGSRPPSPGPPRAPSPGPMIQTSHLRAPSPAGIRQYGGGGGGGGGSNHPLPPHGSHTRQASFDMSGVAQSQDYLNYQQRERDRERDFGANIAPNSPMGYRESFSGSGPGDTLRAASPHTARSMSPATYARSYPMGAGIGEIGSRGGDVGGRGREPPPSR